MKIVRRLCYYILTGTLLNLVTSSVFATSYNWTNTASGYWTNAANWNPTGVPTNGDSANVNSISTALTITLDGGDRSLTDLIMRGGGGTAHNLIINLNNGASLTTPFRARQ